MQILIQIVEFSIFLTITHHTFERDFLHQSGLIITMIVQRWFASRSKEFSWNDRETVKRVICNLLPFPLYAITRETNRRGDETHRFFLRISSRAEFIGPTRNRFCRVRIEETASQGWALCQGCHLTARTTLLSVPEYWPLLLSSRLAKPTTLLIIFHHSLQQIFTIVSFFFSFLRIKSDN